MSHRVARANKDLVVAMSHRVARANKDLVVAMSHRVARANKDLVVAMSRRVARANRALAAIAKQYRPQTETKKSFLLELRTGPEIAAHNGDTVKVRGRAADRANSMLE
ncbi:hypothetical protein IJ21_39520 [Paenibacillus sp. 32O-W]|nr:hypothetical protein IJ21_39520 [Paenibacillus sp. 32O-W]